MQCKTKGPIIYFFNGKPQSRHKQNPDASNGNFLVGISPNDKDFGKLTQKRRFLYLLF